MNQEHQLPSEHPIPNEHPTPSGHRAAEQQQDPVQFWEQRYRESDAIWSGRVNGMLAEVVPALEVGTALDLGCGEGGDAVWLAGMGWRVTAVDISTTALARAEAAATAEGVANRVTFEQHDLATDFPSGLYDLVSAQYLQSPIDFPRTDVLRSAAHAVALGGRLLIVDHGAPPPWARGEHQHADFPTVLETFESLQLKSDHWRIDRLEAVTREATGPGGHSGTLVDNVILACRLA